MKIASKRSKLNSESIDYHEEGSMIARGLTVEIECMLYYCDDAGVCLMKGVRLLQPIHVTQGQGAQGEKLLKYRFGRS